MFVAYSAIGKGLGPLKALQMTSSWSSGPDGVLVHLGWERLGDILQADSF